MKLGSKYVLTCYMTICWCKQRLTKDKPSYTLRKRITYQCQLLTFVESGRSSTIHLGSPSPHLAISKLWQTGQFPVFNQLRHSALRLLSGFPFINQHVILEFSNGIPSSKVMWNSTYATPKDPYPKYHRLQLGSEFRLMPLCRKPNIWLSTAVNLS